MALTKEDLAAIKEITGELITNNANLILGELDRVEQRINEKFDKRFDKSEKEMLLMREDIHTTKYSNDTVELLLKKVMEQEKRIADLEKSA